MTVHFIHSQIVQSEFQSIRWFVWNVSFSINISFRSFVFSQSCAKVSVGPTNVSGMGCLVVVVVAVVV